MISVPTVGFDLITISPFTKLTRSRILTRPKPLVPMASSTLKPRPKSRILSSISTDVPQRLTSQRPVPLYLTAFCKASCNTRNKQSATFRQIAWHLALRKINPHMVHF